MSTNPTPKLGSKLLLAPLKAEFSILSHVFQQSWKHENIKAQSHTALFFPEPNLYLATGALGKVDMALKTQFWLTSIPDCQGVACVGCAGSLNNSLQVGDIIVASQTVEHDFKQLFFQKPPPEFAISAYWKSFLRLQSHSQIKHLRIASGDEDIISLERRQEIHQLTGAHAVAWEGAGCARACEFLKIPFCEIRAITDDSSTNLKQDFTKNLNHAMLNLAQWLVSACTPSSF